MKPIVVDQAKFARQVLSEIRSKFDQLRSDGSTEVVGEDFIQARVTVEFIVSARKKKPPAEPEPEPCCVCFRAGEGIVCAGECCAEVFVPDTPA